MKKILLLSIIILPLLLSSCESFMYVTRPYYTSVDKMMALQAGMSVDGVNAILGIPPHDFYHTHESGSKVLAYHYRLKYTKIKGSDGLAPSSTGGKPRSTVYEGVPKGDPYYEGQGLLYVLFRDDKFVSVITDLGKESSEYLMVVNNNIRLLSKGDYNSYNDKETPTPIKKK